MEEFRKAYLILWTAISHAIEEIDCFNIGRARKCLVEAQKSAEETYINWEADTEACEDRKKE